MWRWWYSDIAVVFVVPNTVGGYSVRYQHNARTTATVVGSQGLNTSVSFTLFNSRRWSTKHNSCRVHVYRRVMGRNNGVLDQKKRAEWHPSVCSLNPTYGHPTSVSVDSVHHNNIVHLPPPLPPPISRRRPGRYYFARASSSLTSHTHEYSGGKANCCFHV